MNQFRVRCPSCAKLYQIDVATVFSTSPQFQCVACPTKFTFDFPPTDPQHIECRKVEERSSASIVVAKRKCPRCGMECAQTFTECPSCQVIFEKLEDLPSDPELKAQPSLVRRWKELLEDFGSEEKHRYFVMACRALEALPFAKYKYEEILRAQGQDPVSERMLEQIAAMTKVAERPATPAARVREKEASKPADAIVDRTPAAKPVITAKFAPPPSPLPAPKAMGLALGWIKFALVVCCAICAMAVLIGFSGQVPRNVIGVGLAVGFLSGGLAAALPGKVSLSALLKQGRSN